MPFERALGPGAGRSLFPTPAARLALLRAAWPRVVGPELARRTQVVALEGRTLRVRVPSGPWRPALYRMRREVLARLREIAGEPAPRALGIMEGAVPEPPATAPSAAAPEAARPSAELVAAAAAITDAELREDFLASAARYLARGARERKG
jgi:hypothetical protein